MLTGLGGVSSSAPAWVPSNTQSVDTRISLAPTSSAARARVSVVPTKLRQARSRSAYMAAKSLRIIECTITSGLNLATLANTASLSSRSRRSVVNPPTSVGTNRCTGQCTTAPWRSENTLTMFDPTKPVPPVT